MHSLPTHFLKAVSIKLAVLCVCILVGQAWGQEPAGAEVNSRGAGKSQAGAMLDAQAAAEEPTREPTREPMRAKPMGRLPRYFSSLVTSEQRIEIYRIQANYAERLRQLQEQLDALKLEELAALEQILDDAQREQLANLRLAAMARVEKRSQAMAGAKEPLPLESPAIDSAAEGASGDSTSGDASQKMDSK